MRSFIAAILVLLLPALSMAQSTEAVVFTQKGEVPLKLELAVTQPAREKGLMHRQQLAPYDGMLFVFPTPSTLRFWMKNTPLPLDMLFIDTKHRIIHISANTVPFSTDVHASNGDAIAVIELDGGRASRDGIAVGDNVRYALPDTVIVD